MLPSIFGENLFDDSLSDFFDFGRAVGEHLLGLVYLQIKDILRRRESGVFLEGPTERRITHEQLVCQPLGVDGEELLAHQHLCFGHQPVGIRKGETAVPVKVVRETQQR